MAKSKYNRLQQLCDELLRYSFIVAPVGLLLAVLLYAFIAAKIGADAFNRLTTGPKVTIMDALFLDLRVEAK